MSTGVLLDRLRARVELDRQEGDIAYFYALSLYAEYLTKITTAAVVAFIGDDPDRHRYSLEHALVRANALGDWAEGLTDALTGSAAQFFDPRARDTVRDLTERVTDSDWRHGVVTRIATIARMVHADVPVLGQKMALRQFFQINAAMRNKTRGHGAVTGEVCSAICPEFQKALDTFVVEFQLFREQWAHLHRNLSGKFRVSPLLGDCGAFDYLKATRDVRLQDGVYIHLGRPVHVPLVVSDQDLRDIHLPNGNYSPRGFELLSYVTNDMTRRDGSPWADPPHRLPPSATNGQPGLGTLGNLFANLPPRSTGYVPRKSLERQLLAELQTTDRHPVVSLTGPGGIGKTTLALAVLEALADSEGPPYNVVLWLSARDIDLLDIGPKPVAPRVVRQRDIAMAAADLLESAERQKPGFDPMAYFQRCLTDGAAGPTLFVVDNFETLESPGDVFRWLDTYVRPPNKVLITTRYRDFAGDMPIDVRGMSDEEASDLIDREAARLGIQFLVDRSYVEEIVRESDGHPYVIKILLGHAAKERRAIKPERIVAGAGQLLKALFERTFSGLSPAGQRVFLLLCSWRVMVPEVAVEAVCLRPGNERFDVALALEELRRFSLTEEVVSEADGSVFVGVPLAASIYGRRKLEVSPLKVAVEEDRRLLMEFGAGKREDVHRGVLPRVDRLVRTVASAVNVGRITLEVAVHVLEYIASSVPAVYLHLVDLTLEGDGGVREPQMAKAYLLKYLEAADVHDRDQAWRRLANLCADTGDTVGEVHALSELALLPTSDIEAISAVANQINNRIRELKGRMIDDAWSPEVRALIGKVVETFERRLNTLSATDCSRLAWLQLNIGEAGRAREIARIGLERDPDNQHCRNLVDRLRWG